MPNFRHLIIDFLKSKQIQNFSTVVFRGSTVTLLEQEGKREPQLVLSNDSQINFSDEKTVGPWDTSAKQARVLFDYQANSPNEISIAKNEVRQYS